MLWDPVVCGSPTGCHNAFCSDCINSWVKLPNRQCPTCNKPFIQNSAPPLLTSILRDLMLKCPYYQNGCEQKLKYLELRQHLRICLYKSTYYHMKWKSAGDARRAFCKKTTETIWKSAINSLWSAQSAKSG